ncbi:hypothetical protein CHS0354_006959 [Potamilus streckersoni]|uniref:SOWAHA-C winged helix-turn-helix domain-containing protein n=1 Tax=Potamilus streckersoni TaxID=2493646 RepID=A0AAE0S6F3_9BIVA|nr:hypothetical protein CHS0354_006959 [Potamilus streckersoni]
MATREFTMEAVKEFIVNSGGKVTNHDLVTKFKNYLNDPQDKVLNREKFKDFVNTLATIKLDEKGEKLLVLKKKFKDRVSDKNSNLDITDSIRALSEPPRNARLYDSTVSLDGRMSSRVHSEGNLSDREGMSISRNSSLNDSIGSEISSSSFSSTGAADEDANLSLMSVKERAQHLNRIESESQLQNTSAAQKKREIRTTYRDKDGDEDSTGTGYVELDSIEKEWLATCASADYHKMHQLLNKKPALARLRTWRWQDYVHSDGKIVCIQMTRLYAFKWQDCLHSDDKIICIQMTRLSAFRWQNYLQRMKLGSQDTIVAGNLIAMFEGKQDTILAGNLIAMFEGKQDTIVAGNLIAMFEGKQDTIVAGNLIANFEGKQDTILAGNLIAMFEGKQDTFLAGNLIALFEGKQDTILTGNLIAMFEGKQDTILTGNLITMFEGKQDTFLAGNLIALFEGKQDTFLAGNLIALFEGKQDTILTGNLITMFEGNQDTILAGYLIAILETALHFAAKHGKAEVVKMIAAKSGVNVNQRTGYTPLHLAAMQGHEDIIELLVHTYKADPNVRDYSGKKAKQYLKFSASSRAQQLLVSSRLSSKSGKYDPDDSFMRSASFRKSNRVRAISSLIQGSGTGMKQFQTSWDDMSIKNTTPKSTPSTSPANSAGPSPVQQRKGHFSEKEKSLMPPPNAPTKKCSRQHYSYSKESLISEEKRFSEKSPVTRSESEPNLGGSLEAGSSKQTYV